MRTLQKMQNDPCLRYGTLRQEPLIYYRRRMFFKENNSLVESTKHLSDEGRLVNHVKNIVRICQVNKNKL